MAGLLTLLALFVRTGGCAARNHHRPDGLALQRSQEVRGLLTLQTPSHALTAAQSVFAPGTMVLHRSYEKSGQLTLPALLVLTDGCTVSHHSRPDGLALRRSRER